MERLKAPIAGDLAFGVYLKGEKPIYRGLRNAFNAAQAAWRSLSETQESLENRELAAANTAAWTALADKCETCLRETSKDLEILTWFTAAQLHSSRPLPNCAGALTVLADLVQNNLEQLQPIPPSDKLKGDTEAAQAAEIAELRLRPFVQLVGEVEGSGLLAAPMAAHRLIGDVTYGKYLLAEKNGTIDVLRAEAGLALESQTEALLEKIEALQEMERQFEKLDVRLKKYASENGQQPPMIGYGRRIVNDILVMAQRLVEGTGFPWPGAGETASQDEAIDQGSQQESGTVEASSSAAAKTGFDPFANVVNRQEALMAIARLAIHFRTTEPHSPISLLLDRAVRWGNLSAGDLYREILTEGSVGMAQMALMTGLESHGFSDSVAKGGSGNNATTQHPTLPDYASVLPAPINRLQNQGNGGAELQSNGSMVQNVLKPSELLTEKKEEKSAETGTTPQSTDLPVESFEW